jgi:hypothetical protein
MQTNKLIGLASSAIVERKEDRDREREIEERETKRGERDVERRERE